MHKNNNKREQKKQTVGMLDRHVISSQLSSSKPEQGTQEILHVCTNITIAP